MYTYTPAPIAQSLAEAIYDPRAPATVVSALAEALLGDLRYTTWFLEQKNSQDESVLLNLLAEYDSAMIACRQGWLDYKNEHSPSAEANLLQQVAHFQSFLRRHISV